MKFKPDNLFKENEGNKLFEYMTSEFTNPVISYGIESFKSDLWKFSKAAIKAWRKNIIIQDFTKVARTIIEIMEGAWRYLKLSEEYDFEHPALNIQYTKNVFRQRLEHRFLNQKEMYNYDSPFYGILHQLTKEEIRDFTIVIKSFFAETDLSAWKIKMIKWSEYANRTESIIESSHDDLPLNTYENLLKLAEAAYVADDLMKTQQFKPPNFNLFKNEEIIIELDLNGYGDFNPLLELNWIFHNYTANDLKTEFEEWSDFAKNKSTIWDKGEPRELIQLQQDLVCLLEAGWAMIKFDEIPEKWLNPNEYRDIYQKKESDENNKLNIRNLLEEECTDLPHTLSLAYYNFPLNTIRNYFKDMLESALSTQNEKFQINEQLHNSIHRIIEILYLINFENLKKVNGSS